MNGNKNINELTEKQFLENYNPDEYARQSVTVDLMILGVNEDYSSLRILLVKRDEHPHKGRWGLPGGFIKEDETAYASATRVLNNKTHLKNVYLDQIYTFTKPDRDPRMRIMSIAYLSLVSKTEELKDDNALWFDLAFADDRIEIFNEEYNIHMKYKLKKQTFKNGSINYENYTATSKGKEVLAFDHIEIVIEGIKRLRDQILYGPQAFCLVDNTFTLPEMQAVFELVLNKPLYKKSFRDMISSKIVETGNDKKSKVAGGRKSKEYMMKR
ncbi:NUDIX domain-containing protein [Eubacterium sp.]|uniref:NUDIX hydrolase n=1 Tax=Eubacterium sp. TaxID=142586 RepID=UPI0025DBB934|nr:NUDIX domain-containing protein [Eubacterium sp.]MCR5628890.1 NUDIX domain-containing protein [Eubacterium sp.]